MSQPSEKPDPLDPFSVLRTVRDTNLEAWSKIMIEVVNSDAYAQAMAKWLDAYLTVSQPFQRVLESTMARVLTSLNMPVRSDVTGLAERLTNIEMSLDDLRALVDDEFQRLPLPGESASISQTPKEKHL